MAVEVKAWEDQNQKDLRTLAGLIGNIRDVVRKSGGRAILKYNASKDNLVFSELRGNWMLPKGLYSKWEGSDEQSIDLDVKLVVKTLRAARTAEKIVVEPQLAIDSVT